MEGEIKMYPGQRMKELRRQKGLSLNALASMVMVDPSTISRWETHREFIHIARFIQALYALGVTPEEFLGLENPYPAMEEVAA